jgi:hypothetical protein
MFKKYVILLYERYAALVKGNIRNDSDNITAAIRSTLETNKDPEVKRAKLKPLLKKKNIHAQIKREIDQLQLSSVKKQKLDDTVKTEPEDVKTEPVDVKTEPEDPESDGEAAALSVIGDDESPNTSLYQTPHHSAKKKNSSRKPRSIPRKGDRIRKQTEKAQKGGSKKPWIHLK